MARGNPENLRAAAQRKSDATVKRAETALRTMIKQGEPIGFRGLARTAGCSIDFLYGNPELRRRIEHLRAQQQTKPSPPAADANADSNVGSSQDTPETGNRRARAAIGAPAEPAGRGICCSSRLVQGFSSGRQLAQEPHPVL